MTVLNAPPEESSNWLANKTLAVLFAAGFAVRLALAVQTFLNPDEALHYWLSVQASLWLAYQASLTTVHPPLLILFLNLWRLLGHSEWLLRLPSIVAGLGFAWFSFKWLERVAADRRIATLVLILLLFAPSLIALTSEVRQYAFLVFFIAASVYFFDAAIMDSSNVKMWVSGTALLLALFTHYSALLFALSLAIYGLLRLYPLRQQTALLRVWIAVQMVCLVVGVYFLLPHIRMLRTQGVVQDIADTWLRASIYHPGEISLLFFLGRETLRLFRYLFGQPSVGPLGLVCFVWGIWVLLHAKPHTSPAPSPRQLAVLLLAPLLINIVLCRVYPYGGTRHNAFLALFVMTGVGFALGSLRFASRWTLPAILIALMAISNISPSPGGPFIRRQDQQLPLMHQAINLLTHSVAPGAVILSDYQGALVLGYYLCGARVVLVESSPSPYPQFPCGPYRIMTTDARHWSFSAKAFPAELEKIAAAHPAQRSADLWLFQTGWGIASDRDWPGTLASVGCTERVEFGRDISVCRLPSKQTPESAARQPK